MGFFSWKTNDTNKSIGNIYGDLDRVFTVYMVDDKGNKWVEDAYEGYGVFGGKDYYELLAEMNGLPSERDEGINLIYHSDRDDIKYPNLVQDPDWQWVNEKTETCEYQGYFYP